MENKPSQLNGIIVSATISWIRSAYGDEIIEKALANLPSEQSALFKKLVISLGWYDITLYEKFIALCHAEVYKKTKESREKFDQRGIEEGGGAILKSIYKFIFSMMQPDSILNRMTALFKRNYSHGTASIIQNKPGYCLLQFDIPKDMYTYLLRQNNIGYRHVLKLSGAKNITINNTELATTTGYQIRTELIYQQ